MLRTILIIEDDRDIAQLVALHLQDLGCAVEVVHNGHAGLRRALTMSYDLIILDLMPPGSPIFRAVQEKRCKALCRALKKSPKPPESAVGVGSKPSHVDWSVGAPF
jgi:DNA-binding response OmpR family regulator